MKKIMSSLLIMVMVLSCVMVNTPLNLEAATTYRYTTADSLMRDAAGQSASIKYVILKGIKLDFISETTMSDGTKYSRVKISSGQGAYYASQHEGYILSRRLQTTATSIAPTTERNLTLPQQTALVKAAENIMKNRSGSAKFDKAPDHRWSGFHNTKIGSYYYYDCSSFVSSVFKEALGVNLVDGNTKYNGKTYTYPWTTYRYIDDIDKNNSKRFRQVIKKTSGSISTSSLMAGDVILGEGKNGASNHIMFYIGDEYMIHMTTSGIKKVRVLAEPTRLTAGGMYATIRILRYKGR